MSFSNRIRSTIAARLPERARSFAIHAAMTCGWIVYYTILLILIVASFEYGASDITNFEYKVF